MDDFPDIKDFGALADAAAAERLSSQRMISTPIDSPIQQFPAHQTMGGSATQSMSQSQSQSRTPSSAAPNQEEEEEDGEEEEEDDYLDTQPPAPIGSDISAWETAIQTLPAEFSNTRRFAHPLASMLADQNTILQIEWNPNRQNGGFVPRTPTDFSAMMIFICGQINPNPCRNCRLQNGPFARCIVAPPGDSGGQHHQACRCTNDPITHEERMRSQVGRAARTGCKVRKPKPHIPKSQFPPAPLRQESYRGPQGPHPPYHTLPLQRTDAPSYRVRGSAFTQTQTPTAATQPLPALGKPSSESGSVKSFADKVRMARAWNQQSRRRMKAELLQWQATLATVDAERPRKIVKHPVIQAPPPPPPMRQQRPQQPSYQQQPQSNQNNYARPPPPATPSYRQQGLPSSSHPQSVPASSYPQSTPSSYPQYVSAQPNGRAPTFQPSNDVSMGDQDDCGSDVTDSEEDEEGGGGEDHTWAGFDDEEDRAMVRPPVP
ncbi:Bis(5'-adenosyl)-triphosphatase [Apiospora arundinis]